MDGHGLDPVARHVARELAAGLYPVCRDLAPVEALGLIAAVISIAIDVVDPLALAAELRAIADDLEFPVAGHA